MNYVLTLIGSQISQTAERAQRELGGTITWLDDDRACDIAPIAKTKMNFQGLDWALQPIKNRKKKLLTCDMDSTLVKQETLDLLAELADAQKEVAAITEKAMQGEIDFAAALTERVSLLKGLKESALKEVLHTIELNDGAKTLTATMKANGASCLLLSGGFDFLVAPIAARAGLEAGQCNKLEIVNGVLTGKLIPPLYDALAKKRLMLEKAKALGLTADDIIAVGDGANDIPMIETAGLGVCFGNKKILAEKADCQIQYNDLTALLFIQGYALSTFI